MSAFAACFRRVFVLCALLSAVLTSGSAAAQRRCHAGLVAAVVHCASSCAAGGLRGARVLPPIQRAAFAHRSPSAVCARWHRWPALIDRPFAFNAKLELFIRPSAADGNTALLLNPLRYRCRFWDALKWAWDRATRWPGLRATSPLHRRRHRHRCQRDYARCGWRRRRWCCHSSATHTSIPALAAGICSSTKAGPFAGLNQLGLPGPLSKMSLMYRHPLGDLELSGAATVLLDHISRAGTLQLGAHAGYRVPFGEHLWVFGQAILQMPSWGPVLLDVQHGKPVDLSPPVAGTLAIGAQQRADFGFGVGLTVMFTKSDLETRVDLLFRLLSFEVGPHMKPLFPRSPSLSPRPRSMLPSTRRRAARCVRRACSLLNRSAQCRVRRSLSSPCGVCPFHPQRRQCPPGLVPAAPPSLGA